ncbi:MAG: metal ABC transporter permease [Thermodesulfobacteriota bacterium]
MAEFFSALTNPDLPFLRYGLISGILASIPFGIIGSYVVVRRISYIAGAISHCVLAGIGCGLYIHHGLGINWFGPLHGAIIVALLAAVILSIISRNSSERQDSVIGAIWAVGMAIGLLFIAKTPGYLDPMSYLFGNILLVTRSDLTLVLCLDILILAVVGRFYNQFLAISFDEEYAELRGVSVGWYNLLLLCLTALTIVLLVRVVGIVMVIALLTLPAAIGAHFSTSLRRIMVIAIFCCMGFVTIGLGISYNYDLPSGPVIIILAGLGYFGSLLKK